MGEPGFDELLIAAQAEGKAADQARERLLNRCERPIQAELQRRAEWPIAVVSDELAAHLDARFFAETRSAGIGTEQQLVARAADYLIRRLLDNAVRADAGH